MRERLSVLAAWHWGTAVQVLSRMSPWALLVPVAGVAAIYLLNMSPAISPYLDKPHAEFISPLILALGVVVSAALTATRLEPYFDWLALWALALFLRELHFQGTNTGFYIAIVLLLGWASTARDRLEPFISNKGMVTLLMAILWTYAVSKTFDRHYWDAVLPAGITNNLFEENLEILGHVLVVVLVVVSAFADGSVPPLPRRE